MRVGDLVADLEVLTARRRRRCSRGQSEVARGRDMG